MTDDTNAKLDNGIVKEMVGGDEPKASEAEIAVIKEMIMAGLAYGHKKSRTNPKFKKFVFTTRNGMEIIDLPKTLLMIESAVKFLKDQIEEGKMVLFVATQSAAWDAIEGLANKLNMPYVKNKWIGGLITNFKVLSGRIEYYKKTQLGMEKGEFDKYTKKERVMINKDVSKMKKMFGGLENLIKSPDAIFLIDTSIKGHNTAMREALRMKVPIIGIIDSDDNPDMINYPIPANDHAKMSIEWVINKIQSKLE